MGRGDEDYLRRQTALTILVITYGYPPSDGGVQVYAAGVANGFRQLGESVVVLAPSCRGFRVADAKQPFPIYRSPSMLLLREIWMLLVALWLLRKYHVTAILSTVWLPCGVISWLVTRVARVPYWLSAHGSELLDTQNIENPLKHQLRKRLPWLKRIVLRDASAVFAVSNHTRQLVMSQGVSPDKVFLVLNGVDSARFYPQSAAGEKVLTRHDLHERKIILTVARLDNYKGHDTVIRSMPKVLAAIPEAVYLIVGRGPERQSLGRLAEELGVVNSVVFAGYVPDQELFEYYNACDIFVMISSEDVKDVEGFGLVYLEANACGKPVIGGDSGGVRDAIIHGQTGYVVNPSDVDAVFCSIVRLLSDPTEARRLGETGYRRAKSQLGWALVVERMRTIMRQVDGVDER